MKILLIAVGTLVGLFALVWICGMMLPSRHVASRSLRLARPPGEVWTLLADFASYGKWAPEVSGTSRLADQNGHPVWAMQGKWAMPLELEVVEPPRRLVTRIADPKLPFGGTWTWEVSADGAGTRVDVTERGEIKAPLFRTLTRFVFGYTSTMDAYLKAMARHFGEAAAPGPGPAGA